MIPTIGPDKVCVGSLKPALLSRTAAIYLVFSKLFPQILSFIYFRLKSEHTHVDSRQNIFHTRESK